MNRCCPKCNSFNVADLMKDIGEGTQGATPYSCVNEDCPCHKRDKCCCGGEYPNFKVHTPERCYTNFFDSPQNNYLDSRTDEERANEPIGITTISSEWCQDGEKAGRQANTSVGYDMGYKEGFEAGKQQMYEDIYSRDVQIELRQEGFQSALSKVREVIPSEEQITSYGLADAARVGFNVCRTQVLRSLTSLQDK